MEMRRRGQEERVKIRKNKNKKFERNARKRMKKIENVGQKKKSGKQKLK